MSKICDNHIVKSKVTIMWVTLRQEICHNYEKIIIVKYKDAVMRNEAAVLTYKEK